MSSANRSEETRVAPCGNPYCADGYRPSMPDGDPEACPECHELKEQHEQEEAERASSARDGDWREYYP